MSNIWVEVSTFLINLRADSKTISNTMEKETGHSVMQVEFTKMNMMNNNKIMKRVEDKEEI
jgi:hypothetical protein